MKTYELVLMDNHKGVFKVSVVKDPAIEATLIKFSEEHEKPLHFMNEEKRIIYAVAMRPNKLIFRKNVSQNPNVIEAANVYYTAETVERLQENYFRQNGNLSTNINHSEENTSGVFPFESWIVQNSEVDKTKTIGLEAIKGDWVMGFKIDNEQVWNDCKNGNLDGLSIEAHLGFKESINFNNEKKMTKAEKFLDMVTQFFAGETPAETPTPTPEVEEPKDEKAEKIAELEAELAEVKAELEALKAENANVEADKVKAETELVSMKAEKLAKDAELVKMTSQYVDALKIKNTPSIEMTVEKPYDQMSNKEKMKFNRDNR